MYLKTGRSEYVAVAITFKWNPFKGLERIKTLKLSGLDMFTRYHLRIFQQLPHQMVA